MDNHLFHYSRHHDFDESSVASSSRESAFSQLLHEHDGDLLSVIDGEDGGIIQDGDKVEIDIPLGQSYAKERKFWRQLFLTGILGALLGCVGYGYLESIEKIQEFWFYKDGYGKTPDASLNGDWIYVPVLSATGLVVGILRYLLQLEHKQGGGLFKDIQEQHVDPVHAIKVVIASFVSLVGGASLGPEAALGSLGGGLTQYWSEYFGLDEETTKENVLFGICGAMGSLFPSPVIAVVCLIESGRDVLRYCDYMRILMLLTVPAILSFATYYALKDDSYLPFNPIALFYEFHSLDNLKAAVIGFLSGITALVFVIVAAIFQKVFARMRNGLGNTTFLAYVLPSVIGSALVGLIGYYVPLTLGSGSKQTKDVVLMVLENKLDAGNLFLVGFAKMLTFAISKGSGLIGGSIFPMLFAATCIGGGFAQLINVDWLNPLLCMTCFMSMPVAIAPMPLTIFMMIFMSFQFSAYSTTPIFVACTVSHLTISGLGLIRGLLNATRKSKELGPTGEEGDSQENV